MDESSFSPTDNDEIIGVVTHYHRHMKFIASVFSVASLLVAGALVVLVRSTILPAAIQQFGRNVRDTFPGLTRELPAIQLGVFGLVIIAFLLFEPRGLARLWQRTRDYFRLWPFRY